jgi:HAD superfamily hydrolase (TIGR01490 family)
VSLRGRPKGECRNAQHERPPVTRLALFDLDHTLLSGDSDVLWCDFLMAHGALPRADFDARNADMDRRYREGSVTPAEFCNFYVSTLAGRAPGQWQAWRERFLADVVAPRIPDSAHALVDSHRRQGDMLVLTTATNRFIVELTALHLGIEHLIATEAQLENGRFTGRSTNTPNMREGKVVRLAEWMSACELPWSLLADASFYSDSSNDLPLLREVGHPVAVDPDARLLAAATEAGWPVLNLKR